MFASVHFGFWDWALLVAVPVQATFIAYLHSPRSKALMLSFPVPFSISCLTLGQPVSAHHVLGLVVLLGFTYGVYFLRNQVGLPIVLSIVLAAAAYCVTAAFLAPCIPKTAAAFCVAVAGVFVLGLTMYLLVPHTVEPGYRTPLPLWLKFPLIVLVVSGILAIKAYLQGFMTLFPMVGVIAAYEARYSLRAICRQIPVIMLTILPMEIVMWLSQPSLGMGWALALGWVVFLPALYLITRDMWARADRQVGGNGAGAETTGLPVERR